MSVAELLWDLLGNWQGVEEQSASPFAPAATTRAMLTFKQDLAGTAVLQDYRQVRDDGAEFLAHGVFLAGPSSPDAVLWWLFDSAAQAPEPAPGTWAGRHLALVRRSPRGSAHHDFRLDGRRLAYAIDLELADQPRTPFLRGRYERVSGH
ncbi:hypothetical protein [Microlunatus flavus]|uniref:hypothetical protein n=1 Tax=Microlunatus flavus TaxID=1036181 RepID=UPI000B80B752|nr:hypothetical protein [Microlunatus flavus]